MKNVKQICIVVLSISLISCQYFRSDVEADNSTYKVTKESLYPATKVIYSREARKVLFDTDWKFNLEGMQGAEQKDFNDSSWRLIDLPHDWSIEDLKNTKSPFDSRAISQANTGFTVGGTAWYRKAFTLPASSAGRKMFIEFEGVYMNSDVWINGQNLGNRPYGYTGFQYDITPYLLPGSNTIAVEVKNEGRNSRWYSGSGIYRHVWLHSTELLHIDNQTTQITTTNISPSTAGVKFTASVNNESAQPIQVKSVVNFIDQSGTSVAKEEISFSIKSHSKQLVNRNVTIKSPALWSVESPALYKAVHQIYLDNQLADEEETVFGIRTIALSVTDGFQLNGKKIKLKGGCLHHDNGPLGSKAYDRAEERKIELLKKSGFNALRCAHNPPSIAFLDACDRLGMLVIDEAFDSWNYGKNPYDYHLYFKDWGVTDIEAMVTRDRNHPSVILWSTGNEIPETNSPEGKQTSVLLKETIRRFDTTRLVTNAVCDINQDKDPFFATLDITGYNYAVGVGYSNKKLYVTDHERNPARIMFGAESYPLNAFGSWMEVVDHPYVTGDFVWTAFDYIGEASIGWLGYPQSASFYPWNLAFCGDLDICGFKRPQSYYRDALWMEDQLSIFVQPPIPSYQPAKNQNEWSTWNWFDLLPDWNWKGYEGKPLNVSAYSSCDEVELLLNEKSLGRKPTNRSTEFKTNWNVPYKNGTLKAVGYTNGKKVTETQIQTAGKPANIVLTPDRKEISANGQDLSYVVVELQDKANIPYPKSGQQLNFSVQGAGTIVAVGNADPVSVESYTTPQRKTWKGKCLVIIKAGKTPGNITLTAKGENLPSKQITIVCK